MKSNKNTIRKVLSTTLEDVCKVGNGRQERSNGGAERDRTVGLLNAIQALSQLSYSPTNMQNNTVKNRLSNPILIDMVNSFLYIEYYAGVVKLVDARDSKSRGPQAHVGSIPTSGTIISIGYVYSPDPSYPRFSPDCDKNVTSRALSSLKPSKAVMPFLRLSE